MVYDGVVIRLLVVVLMATVLHRETPMHLWNIFYHIMYYGIPSQFHNSSLFTSVHMYDKAKAAIEMRKSRIEHH